MKTKKQTQKPSQQKPTVNAAPTNKQEPETPQVDNKQDTVAPAATPEPVTPPPAASTEKPKEEKPKKEKAPSISAAVRRIVIKNPSVTAAEVSQRLIEVGWDATDVEKRTSTIATLRTDALSIIAIAKEEGCWK